MSVAAVLLAAGLSRRFGDQDKLRVLLNGIPLGLHAARTLASLQIDHRIVVTGPAAMDWQDFTPVINEQQEAGIGRSLALGVRSARERGAGAVLVALADMPFVSRRHFVALLGAYAGPDSIVATRHAARRMPPAVFGSAWFADLANLDGDVGAKHLLADARTLETDPAELIDIDSSADLTAAAQH